MAEGADKRVSPGGSEHNSWPKQPERTPRDTAAGPEMSAWLAANSGNRQTLCSELEKGADIEHKDPMGRTALMEAAKYGHVDCVHELLDRGADPTVRSAMGYTAQDYTNNNPQISQLLEQATQRWLAERQGRGTAATSQGAAPSSDASSGKDPPDHSRHYSQSPRGRQLGSSPSPRASQLSASPHGSSFSSQSQLHQQHQQGQVPSSIAAAFQMGSSSLSMPPTGMTSRQQQQQQLQAQAQAQLQQAQQAQAQAQAHAQAQQAQQAQALGPVQQGLFAGLPPQAGGPQGHLGMMPSQLMGSLATQQQALMQAPGIAAMPGPPAQALFNGLPNGLPPLSNHSPTVSPAGMNMGRPVCRYWHSGRCLYGAHCRFAHPATPAPTAPPATQPVCRYWRFGTCRYGPACRFRHPIETDPNAPRGSNMMRPANMQQLPRSALAEQLSQQRARNFGFTDAEMMDLLARKPWEDATDGQRQQGGMGYHQQQGQPPHGNAAGSGRDHGRGSDRGNVISALQGLTLGSNGGS